MTPERACPTDPDIGIRVHNLEARRGFAGIVIFFLSKTLEKASERDCDGVGDAQGVLEQADGREQVRTVHARAGGGAGEGLQRVPQAQLAEAATADPRVPHPVQHRAQADQSLVPESQMSGKAEEGIIPSPNC